MPRPDTGFPPMTRVASIIDKPSSQRRVIHQNYFEKVSTPRGLVHDIHNTHTVILSPRHPDPERSEGEGSSLPPMNNGEK